MDQDISRPEKRIFYRDGIKYTLTGNFELAHEHSTFARAKFFQMEQGNIYDLKVISSINHLDDGSSVYCSSNHGLKEIYIYSPVPARPEEVIGEQEFPLPEIDSTLIPMLSLYDGVEGDLVGYAVFYSGKLDEEKVFFYPKNEGAGEDNWYVSLGELAQLISARRHPDTSGERAVCFRQEQLSYSKGAWVESQSGFSQGEQEEICLPPYNGESAEQIWDIDAFHWDLHPEKADCSVEANVQGFARVVDQWKRNDNYDPSSYTDRIYIGSTDLYNVTNVLSSDDYTLFERFNEIWSTSGEITEDDCSAFGEIHPEWYDMNGSTSLRLNASLFQAWPDQLTIHSERNYPEILVTDNDLHSLSGENYAYLSGFDQQDFVSDDIKRVNWTCIIDEGEFDGWNTSEIEDISDSTTWTSNVKVNFSVKGPKGELNVDSIWTYESSYAPFSGPNLYFVDQGWNTVFELDSEGHAGYFMTKAIGREYEYVGDSYTRVEDGYVLFVSTESVDNYSYLKFQPTDTEQDSYQGGGFEPDIWPTLQVSGKSYNIKLFAWYGDIAESDGRFLIRFIET